MHSLEMDLYILMMIDDVDDDDADDLVQRRAKVKFPVGVLCGED